METLSPPLAPALVVPVPPTPETPVCASCHTPLAGPYCHACGEKRLHRHDYALKHFLEHTVDTVTHFDLRVLRDLWLQLRRPGFLAAEWLQGRRVAHAPPVQLFLITNLLFYLVASVSHFSPFESKLTSHLHSTNGYRPFANRLVLEHLRHMPNTHFQYTEFERHFNALAHSYSKSLVFLFIPLLLPPLWLLFWRQRRYFVEWIMVNTYLFAGILLLYAVVALVSLSAFVVPALMPLFNNDGLISLMMLLLTIGYTALFFNHVFPLEPTPRGWRRMPAVAWRWSKPVLYTAAFVVAMIAPYRFALFLVCYWAAS
ncbi:DUF3667 domain-containing protein [Hymenobacter monticola]|uniref:DUF3667 domain-containing protein n=1 Tax=Hymenobacter monticola TaxID=1705399 RepID=A0ABY4B830_9BACT|nr:DUF3667 domain-containing protein [Hymenobacter monticola]UOE34151.1 DUF3667 domain-containing protein [Hymenobacter monticola]